MPGAEQALAAYRQAIEIGQPFRYLMVDSDRAVDVMALFTPEFAKPGAAPAIPVLVASRGQREKLPEAVAQSFVTTLPRPLRRAGLSFALTTLSNSTEPGRQIGPPAPVEPAKAAAPKRAKWRPVSTEEALAADALILIAEDNPTNQIVMKNLMNRLGYCIDVAANGVEALKMLENAGKAALQAADHRLSHARTRRVRADQAPACR
jgi:hypothetical protein